MVDTAFRDEKAYASAFARTLEEVGASSSQALTGAFLVYWDLGPMVTMRELRAAQGQVSGLIQAMVRYEVTLGARRRIGFALQSPRAAADQVVVVSAGGYVNPWWEMLQVLAIPGGVSVSAFVAFRGVKHVLSLISEAAAIKPTIQARRASLKAQIAQSQRDEMRALAELAELDDARRRSLARSIGPRLDTSAPSRSSEADKREQRLSPADAPAPGEARAAAKVLDAAARIAPRKNGSLPELEYVADGLQFDLPESFAATRAARLIEDPTQGGRRYRG